MFKYNEIFLPGAMERLGHMFEFANERLGIHPDKFANMFVTSYIAEEFEAGSIQVVSGMCGDEIAGCVVASHGFPLPRVSRPCSGLSEYVWSGRVAALAQWKYQLRFKEIFSVAPPSAIVKMRDALGHRTEDEVADEIFGMICRMKDQEESMPVQ